MLLAIAMDGNAIHVFHHQIRIARGGNSAIQQPSNIRMPQAGQNLPLLAKAFAEEAGGQRQVNQLDGDLLLELPVGAMRQIDGAHAAATQQMIEEVGADLSRFCLSLTSSLRLCSTGGRLPPFCLASLQQCTHLGRHLRVFRALGLDQFRARRAGSRERLVEDRFDPQKALRCLIHLSCNPVHGW